MHHSMSERLLFLCRGAPGGAEDPCTWGAQGEAAWALRSPVLDDTPHMMRQLSASSPLPLSPPESSGARPGGAAA